LNVPSLLNRGDKPMISALLQSVHYAAMPNYLSARLEAVLASE
jgi:hypothetical protein